jgi:hypothetical protein
MSKWTEYVTKYYNEQKKLDGGYKFKDALKDAAKTYKNQGKPAEVEKKGKKSRTAKNRSRKHKK